MTQSCPPQPQVSVIVPVYNQERYLEECISSIRRQTLAEWECLIINDGSSDSSGEIARRFSEADSRIRYFEQKNRGVSSARNLGMRRASGRYLCFVDGDDFIDAAFLKHLLDASDRGASDLTVAGKLFCDRFPPDKIPALPTCGIFLRREFPLKNNLEFPEGIHPCEDGLFSHFVLALTEKISFCPEAVYHYRQHEQGNHHQIRKRTADILPMIPRWLSLIEEFYEQRHLWKRKAGHLVRFIEHEPFELRLLGMPFSPPEQEILYSIIRDFLTAHCTAAECRRASLHLPFRLLLQSSGFSDFGRRLRRAGKNTGIRRKLLHFCPVPSWRRNGRAQLRQVREQLEEKRHGFDPGLAAPDITLFPIQQTMPSPLISVIVPIYNMESLLPRCLDSLAAQTLRDLEIICVDDGSTDGSGGIVRKYASGDSRFRLITQENSGRAEARNAGIRAAAAPYLGFADPDDYVEPDMYERLYRLAEESGADMVQCSYSPFLPAESGESRGMAEEKLLHIENTACDGVFTEKGEIFRLFLEDRITGVVWSKLFRRLLPGCSAPLEVRLPSSFTSGEDTLYVSRAIARCRSVALTSEKLYHYGLGGPQSVSSRNRKAETRPASYYAVFEMLTREKLREGVLGSNRTAYMNYIVPLLFPDNEMPAGRLRHWAELWREADITSEHVCGMPREQRAYLEAALAGRWIYLRLLQCFWKFKTARRKMFRLRFSKNGIDTLQILGYTLYSAKKFPRSSL